MYHHENVLVLLMDIRLRKKVRVKDMLAVMVVVHSPIPQNSYLGGM